MGSQKSHQNRKHWNDGWPADFACFSKIFVGTVVLWETVEMYGDQWNTAMHERLCLILVIWTALVNLGDPRKSLFKK